MALRFACKTCGEDIFVRFLKIGEAAECRNCGASNPVPESAENVDDEAAAAYQSRPRRLSYDTSRESRASNPFKVLNTLLTVAFLIYGLGWFFYAIYLLMAGSLLGAMVVGAIVAYMGCGLAWFAYNRKMPMTGQIVAPAAGIILFWPFGLFFRLRRFWDSSRFTVYDADVPGETLKTFSSWNEALAFAKKRAAVWGRTMSIFDHARYRKTILGTYMHRIYFVEPSGELRSPPF